MARDGRDPARPARRGLELDPTTVKLEKYKDWIFGLDALTDGTLIIGSPSRTGRDIRMFDPKTGAQLRSISLNLTRGADIAGLKCEGP